MAQGQQRDKQMRQEAQPVVPNMRNLRQGDGPDDGGLAECLAAVIEAVDEYDGADEEHGDLAGRPEDEDLDPDGQPPGGHGADLDADAGVDGGPGDDDAGGHSPPQAGGHSAPGTPTSAMPPQVLRAAETGRAAVEAAKTRAEAVAGAHLEIGETSLVSLPDGRAVFLTWTLPSLRRARVMRVADDGKTIALFAPLQPEDTYPDVGFIVVATGLRMHHQKRPSAPFVPKWQLLLQLHANAGFHPGPVVPKENEECINCQMVPEGAPPKGTANVFYYRCQVCLELWHNCCVERYGPRADYNTFACPACAPDAR